MLFQFLRREGRTHDASDFNKAIFGVETSHAGVSVTPSSALGLVPVYSCVRVISESAAGLPAGVYRDEDKDRVRLPDPPWLRRPNPEMNWFECVERSLAMLNLYGNSYHLITARDRNGFPSELWEIHPDDIEPKRRESTAKLYYLFRGTDELTPFNPTNPNGDILHIKAFNYGGDKGLSPIDVAKQAIGLGLVAEQHGSRFFGHGANPSGVIEVDRNLTPDLANSLKKNWIKQHGGADKSNIPGVLSGGATWKPISIPNDSAQFLETRKFQVGEIARLFRVPPHMIADLEKTSSWGAGIEQQSIGFVVHTLTPWLVRLETAFNTLVPRGQYLKFNVNGLLRGDMKARYESYSIAIQNGFMNRNEVRALEEMNSAEGLNDYLTPLNMSDAAGEDGAPTGGPIAPQGEEE